MPASQRRGNAGLVHVPIKKSSKGDEDEWVVFDIEKLPEPDFAIFVLKDEAAPVDLWHQVALLYYEAGNPKSFIKIAEEGYRVIAMHWNNRSAATSLSSAIAILLSIGAANTRMGLLPELDRSESQKFFNKADKIYNTISTMDVSNSRHEAEYYAGKAYLQLYRGDTDTADKNFSMIFNELNRKNFVPAILGKGFIAFASKNYTLALEHFKQVLRLAPCGPANVRVGIGHCLWKLGYREKAKLAFQRAVAVFPNDPHGLCALAICHLTEVNKKSTLIAVDLLKTSYANSKSHPMTLTLLADHFYYKKDYTQSLELAHKAFKISSSKFELEVMKRSAFVIARCCEAKNDFKFALHYYYEALKEPISEFPLPYYGLVHCYMSFNDVPRSCGAAEKLLNCDPKNSYAMKVLGCLLCNSHDPNKRLKAQKYLKPLLDQNPKDFQARIALATSEEAVDDTQSAYNYKRALKDAEEKDEIVLPEIYNNFGCTLFRLKRYDEAVKCFNLALEVTNEIQAVLSTETDLRPHNIIIKFNLARTKEALFDYGIAEEIYKHIVRQHPSYYYCFIRLGIMARDRGFLYDADTFFKQALECSLLHPDAWSLMGNLHLIKSELDPACKKFGKIFEIDEESKKDSYNIISLANLELIRLQQSIFGNDKSVQIKSRSSRESDSNHMRKALEWYKQVLMREPNNIWAANGVGCVLACKGLLNEARGIFQQILEAKPENFKNVLMNIAHTYMEEKMYYNAIQIYERCNKLSANTDCEVLQYIAKVHFLQKSYDLAKIALIKARRVAPNDNQILFQLGKTLRKVGWQTYQINSGTNLVENLSPVDGLQQIKLAQNIFLTLRNSKLSSMSVKYAAKLENGYCEDLIERTPSREKRLQDYQDKKKILESRVSEVVEKQKQKETAEKKLQAKKMMQEEEDRRRKRDETKMRTEKFKQSLELAQVIEEKKKEKKLKKELEDSSVGFINDDENNDESQKDVKKSSKRKGKSAKRNLENQSDLLKAEDSVPARGKRSKRILRSHKKGSTQDQSVESDREKFSLSIESTGTEPASGEDSTLLTPRPEPTPSCSDETVSYDEKAGREAGNGSYFDSPVMQLDDVVVSSAETSEREQDMDIGSGPSNIPPTKLNLNLKYQPNLGVYYDEIPEDAKEIHQQNDTDVRIDYDEFSEETTEIRPQNESDLGIDYDKIPEHAIEIRQQNDNDLGIDDDKIPEHAIEIHQENDNDLGMDDDKIPEHAIEIHQQNDDGMPYLLPLIDVLPTYVESDCDPVPPTLHRYDSDDEV